MTHTVEAQLAYLVPTAGRAAQLVYPPTSAHKTVGLAQVHHPRLVADCRGLVPPATLDVAGFELLQAPSSVADFYDDAAVRRDYYPEVAALLRRVLGVVEVVVFDHNQRSAVRAQRGQPGVRTPVDAAHIDYTPRSGPRRAQEILAAAGCPSYAGHRLALINVWRPIIGPVQDVPLAVCDARTTQPTDFVATEIHHFGEDDLEHPQHSGEIYSVQYNPAHRWYYAHDMQPSEVLLLKNWDSVTDGRASYAPHTGFRNPAAPAGARPRESIEARTLVVYP
ncbi:MAG: methyltransferase [Gammaproteobacteria bacterium]|nr:methyltransferase [Gammaproteobacteria bacterium]